jgi:hypothetical protein
LTVLAEVTIDSEAYLYQLAHSKTDQAGTAHNADAVKPITGIAAHALTACVADQN